MFSTMKKFAVTSAASAVAIGLGVGPAAAQGDGILHVSGGSSFTGSSTNTALTSGGMVLHCGTVAAIGNVAAGTYSPVPPAVHIGNITGLAFSGCVVFATSATVTATITTAWPWWATDDSDGYNTPGEIRNLDLTVRIPTFGCTIHVTGTLPVVWHNSPESLSLNGGALTTTGVGICPSLGATGSMSGTVAVTGAPTDPISLL